VSATARAATARPTTARRGPTPARAATRRRPVLTEVPPAPATVAGNGVFALVVLGMLVAGMGVLLVLNTSLAQGAFEIGALSQAKSRLAVTEQQLLQQVALAESPEALQRRADSLGMVPVAAPVFLRLADGAVLGVPVAAKAAPRAPRVTSLPATGGTAASAGSATSATKPAAGDAAVADPAPQNDAAVADPARSGAVR
jgi:hypothetical protein